MNLVDDTSPFGAYTPSAVVGGLIRLAHSCPPNWLGKQLGQLISKAVLRLSHGPLDASVGKLNLRFYLGGNNSERKFLLMPWRFDQAERDFIRQVMQPDSVFVDIGANVGIYSLWAMHLLRERGRVLAIEPNSRDGAKKPQITTLQMGISDQEGEFELYLDKRNLGGSSLIPIASRIGSTRIKCAPLVTVLDKQGIQGIDVLKIDIEGAEPMALLPFFKSAPPSIYPKYIVIENSVKRWTEDLPSRFLELGYRVSLRTKNNSIYELQAPTGQTP